MKKMLFLSPILALAACAPTQGVKPTLYQATSSEVLATIAQLAPTIQPTRFSNFFSVTAITPVGVTLSAKPVVGLQILNALGGGRPNDSDVVVTFTALQNGSLTSVTHSTSDQRNAEFINRIYSELNSRFVKINQ